MSSMENNDTIGKVESTAKRGPLVALVALVVVLAIAFFAYDALSNARGSGNSGAGAGQPVESQASESTAESESAHADAPMLADYNATVYTETGTPETLVDIADGKPLVINFWATWCPYCVDEMGDFQKIYDEYGDRVSFAFLDCVDATRETPEKAASWLEDNGYALPAYYDTKREAQYLFGASSLPTTVVVSADGEILAATPGRIDAALMRSALDSLL